MAQSGKINSEKLKNTLITIKARFETGTVSKMEDVSEIYSTGLIAALGMGHNGYVTKFNAPENFTIHDLLKLADVSNTDIQLILEVVLKQAQANYQKRDISTLVADSDRG